MPCAGRRRPLARGRDPRAATAPRVLGSPASITERPATSCAPARTARSTSPSSAQKGLEPAHASRWRMPRIQSGSSASASVSPRAASCVSTASANAARRLSMSSASRSSVSRSARAAHERPRLLGDGEHELRVAPSDRRQVAAVGEPLVGELAHRLEHREAVAPGRGPGSPRPARLGRRCSAAHTRSAASVDQPPAKYCEPREQLALRAQRAGRSSRRSPLVSVRCRAGASRRPVESPVSPRSSASASFAGCRSASARVRELERQRESVEPLADPRTAAALSESQIHLPGALEESARPRRRAPADLRGRGVRRGTPSGTPLVATHLRALAPPRLLPSTAAPAFNRCSKLSITSIIRCPRSRASSSLVVSGRRSTFAIVPAPALGRAAARGRSGRRRRRISSTIRAAISSASRVFPAAARSRERLRRARRRGRARASSATSRSRPTAPSRRRAGSSSAALAPRERLAQHVEEPLRRALSAARRARGSTAILRDNRHRGTSRIASLPEASSASSAEPAERGDAGASGDDALDRLRSSVSSSVRRSVEAQRAPRLRRPRHVAEPSPSYIQARPSRSLGA